MTISREVNAVEGTYIGQRKACAIAKRAPAWILRQALLGKIAFRLDPGIPIRYLKADVEAAAISR